MDLFTAADMRAADEAAVRAGIPESTLMANAGRAVADDVTAATPPPARPLVVCGAGNNGGDGYVVARLLAERGIAPRVLALRPHASRAGAAEEARRAWTAHGEIQPLEAGALDAALADADLVIDALFGTGLSRPLEGTPAEVVARLNAWAGPVTSVDVPSGIDGDRAVPPGPHLRADRTVQLAGACPASALPPARFAFGTWSVADIGLPPGALPTGQRPWLTTDADAATALPAPPAEVHKGGAGRVLIVAGSERYAGAGELACRGAHRGGAGLVTLVTPAPFPARWPETIVHPFGAAPDALASAAHDADPRAAARVLGPGLDPALRPALAELLHESALPTVLDATALDASLRAAVRDAEHAWLTPHVGEAARLLELDAAEVSADPVEAARSLAATWRAGVVLKAAGAVIATPDGHVRVVAAGHPGMASGGSGDVLAGLLGAMLAAPHRDATARVAAAVHLHARAGERAARRCGLGMRASDLAQAVPRARRALGGAW
ncbi:MAG: NAD(P)H-hydrate dehydratase [Trueperaceae bacterium]|nr:NAD(P)H-hydrate dehydratase [Trueperaceae bacterium]